MAAAAHVSFGGRAPALHPLACHRVPTTTRLLQEILAGEVLGGSLRSKRARLEAVDAIAAALAAAAPPPSPLCLDMRAAAPGVVTLRVELPGRQLAVRNTGHW